MKYEKFFLILIILTLVSCKTPDQALQPLPGVTSPVSAPGECPDAQNLFMMTMSPERYSEDLLSSNSNNWLIMFSESHFDQPDPVFHSNAFQIDSWIDAYTLLIRIHDGVNQEDLLNELLQNKSIRYIEPDHKMVASDIESTDSDWSGEIVSHEWAHERIQTFGAWKFTRGIPEVVVAVIDSGVDFSHPDLASRKWFNSHEILNGVDDDQNGLVDDINGWDYVDNDRFPSPGAAISGAYHGTHVAGVIAGVENSSVGFTGVSPKVKIMALRFLDNNKTGFTSNGVKAIRYAIANGAQIINLSWGSYSKNTALMSALHEAQLRGILVVAASGNYGNDNDTKPFYPASYDYPNIISVTSTSSSDAWMSSMNFGAHSVDLAAPGLNILSTDMNNAFKRRSGSSISAPFVSGAAALLRSYDHSLKAQEIKDLLMFGADHIAKLDQRVSMGRRLNVQNAMSELELLQSNPATNEPDPEPQPTCRLTSASN